LYPTHFYIPPKGKWNFMIIKSKLEKMRRSIHIIQKQWKTSKGILYEILIIVNPSLNKISELKSKIIRYADKF